MKKLTLILGLILAAGILFAQQEGQKPRKQQREMNIEQLRERLNLSDEQFASLQAIHQEMQPKMQALRQDDSKSKAEKMRAQADLIEEREQKVAAILNQQQLTELRAMQAERREQVRERRKNMQERKSNAQQGRQGKKKQGGNN